MGSTRWGACRCDGTVVAQSIAKRRSSRAHSPLRPPAAVPLRAGSMEVPRALLGRGSTRPHVAAFLPILERQLENGLFVCGAHDSAADITTLVAIDFMLHRRGSFAGFTSQSVIRRFRCGPATRSKSGAIERLVGQTRDLAALSLPHFFLPLGTGSRVTCSRSRRPRAPRRVFLPKLSPSGATPGAFDNGGFSERSSAGADHFHVEDAFSCEAASRFKKRTNTNDERGEARCYFFTALPPSWPC
jgi:hypothetical protein